MRIDQLIVNLSDLAEGWEHLSNEYTKAGNEERSDVYRRCSVAVDDLVTDYREEQNRQRESRAAEQARLVQS